MDKNRAIPPTDTSHAARIYGPGYTMAQVCRGCQQRHRCASCLDGSPDEYLPPSAIAAIVERQSEEAGRAMAGDSGCAVLRGASGRAVGFVCHRSRGGR